MFFHSKGSDRNMAVSMFGTISCLCWKSQRFPDQPWDVSKNKNSSASTGQWITILLAISWIPKL